MTESLINQEQVLAAFADLGKEFEAPSDLLMALVQRSYDQNPWFTPENYKKAMANWANLLKFEHLKGFSEHYKKSKVQKRIGVITAGNIPMVGFHDILCVVLSGHIAVIKPSSKDNEVTKFIASFINKKLGEERCVISEQIDKKIDAVIATGSNNSNRYFEQYFSHLPRILRHNRRSIAILNGTESEKELRALSDDIFEYFGMGCRNVSLVFVPRSFDFTKCIDAMDHHSELIHHNKYANNYTYHRALFLMNQQEHLDNGFVLFKEDRSLKAPLGTLFYSYYTDIKEVEDFISYHNSEIQCIVGNYSSELSIGFGQAQQPDLQDYADHVDSMKFLSEL
ncbi:acyl-CoA reductase [bacterium]|nr:acyl-CoA reductase [bacterium]